MVKKYSVCETCGKKIAYTECSDTEAPPEDPKCAALKGWLTVSQWQGFETFGRYEFCSLVCLQKWVEKQVPKIPKAFFEAFKEESK